MIIGSLISWSQPFNKAPLTQRAFASYTVNLLVESPSRGGLGNTSCVSIKNIEIVHATSVMSHGHK